MASTLPCGAASANQGSAIQYRELCAPRDLYALAPSRRPAAPRLTMFVCGARELVRRREAGFPGDEAKGERDDAASSFFEVGVLERHPFTTQTFAPLGVDPAAARRYLVIVAPSLPASAEDAALPAPGDEAPDLPGRGLPDLRRLRAFVATGAQAVTYSAGTWHAPMAALGPPGSAIDFVVTQSANGDPLEDCQEVVLRRSGGGKGVGDGGGGSGIYVRIPDVAISSASSPSKL